MILDDVLTGLDRETEKLVLDAVFGGNGIVKELGQTVVLATNSGLSLAPLIRTSTNCFPSPPHCLL